jgi:hypothetical protein
MTFYEVFGGILQSDLDFPELTAVDGDRPDWTLRRRASLAPLIDAVTTGEEELVGGVVARLERAKDRFRLRFDDTGTFDVSRDGSSITWLPALGATPAVVRADVLGRVLSVALHASGDLCLHASAAAIGGRAVVLVGPRGHGKSTLTMALVAAGARLVADDTARLTGSPTRVAVAVPSLRLREDTAARFGVGTASKLAGDKLVVRDVPVAEERWIPLDAVYVLSPRVAAAGRPPVTRHRLGSLEATLTLVRHGKIAPLLGGAEAASVLPRAGTVARDVPIFSLAITRDLTLLAEVAGQLVGWHSDADALAYSS